MSDIHRKRVLDKRFRLRRAHFRVRNRMRGTAARPRLAVHKSLRYIYAQVIDDDAGRTLVQASTLERELRGRIQGSGANRAGARLVGEVLAKRAKDKGIRTVVFDRGGHAYHGKIKEVAEGARAGGLEF